MKKKGIAPTEFCSTHASSGRTGGVLISFTTTVKELVALSGGVPLSETTVVNQFVLGPCASVGVQVMIPLVSMTAPAADDANW